MCNKKLLGLYVNLTSLFFLIERHFIMKLQFLFENNLPVKRQKKICITPILCDRLSVNFYVLRIQQNDM